MATDMTPEQLEKLIEYAAQRFAKTGDPGEQAEVARLTAKLAELRDIDVLARAVARCRTEDIRIPEVEHALAFLESRATLKWPFEQFRKALNDGNDESRSQSLTASLATIKLVLRID